MEEEESASKLSSLSPQVTRPKLPLFAVPEIELAGAQSKTDHGKGEIRAIMEDIMSLKKKDWKTFSRSCTFTLPRVKSVSMNSSPCVSPCFESPVDTWKAKSRLSRDRSQSLKLLTHKLMNKNQKQPVVEDSKCSNDGEEKDSVDLSRAENPQSDDISCHHLGKPEFDYEQLQESYSRNPDRQSVERVYEHIAESFDDAAQEEREGTKPVSETSFKTVPEFTQDYCKTPRETSHGHDFSFIEHGRSNSDEITSISSLEEPIKAGSTIEGTIDDEGLGEGEEHSLPFVSTYTYHPFPRNSKFLQLAATRPPKRFPPEKKPGITVLKLHSQMGVSSKPSGDDNGSDEFSKSDGEDLTSVGATRKSESDDPKSVEVCLADGQSKHQLQRKSESGKSNVQKLAPRFNTHPPHIKIVHNETGSVDTNGFISLVAADDHDDETKLSQVSLADSQFASELSDHPSYQDVAASLVLECVHDCADRKNGKSGKQKSRSDPSGDRARDNLDFNHGMENPQSLSAPLLSVEKTVAAEVEHSVVHFEEKLKSATEDTGGCQYILGDDTGDSHSSAGEDDDSKSVDTKYPNSIISDSEVTVHPISNFSKSPPPPPPVTPSVVPPVTPHDPSPVPSPQRPSNLLSVPASAGTGRKVSIFRSASSASVLQTRKHLGSPVKEKDFFRKRSITSDTNMVNSRSSANLTPEFLSVGETVNASSMPAVWNKDRLASCTDSPEREPGFIKDKRYHIVEELYRNEKEYVEALRTLKDRYMVPLKTQSSVDDNIVDNIFYMIPEILTHHSVYLDFLDSVWKHWGSSHSTVGNIITTIFSKQTVLESYMSFVENYNASGKVIEHALSTKSSVQRFIEFLDLPWVNVFDSLYVDMCDVIIVLKQCQKDSGLKLSMKDLIVRPIQRIPRYELLIQRLLDNTPQDHPDYPLLQQACKVMHDLAVKIGTVSDSQHGEDMLETLKKLELLLITDLAVPDRAYIRHDMVQAHNKKDQCCIWLFSDVVIISSIKRKSGPVTRKVSIILKTPFGQDFAENIKHKVWLRVGLYDLEIVKTQGLAYKSIVDREQVKDDLNVVTQMAELAGKLTCHHQGLEEVIKDLNSNLSRQLSEVSTRSVSSDSNKMELLVTTQVDVLHIVIGFSTAEKRMSWEAAFTEAKHKLSLLSNKRAPEFLQPLQITKTRAGMQFSCATPIDGVNSIGYRDVWVCNSDGYVGHMCLLSLQPEPIVTLNTPVPGCNARILCICAVPAFTGAFRRRTSQKGQRDSLATTIPEGPHIHVQTADDILDSNGNITMNTPEITMTSSTTASSSAADIDGNDSCHEEGYPSDSDSSDAESVSFINRGDELYVGELISDDEAPKPKVSELTESSSDSVTTYGNWDQDPSKSTMWLGTEDGCIHIFQACDNIKTTKNKLKIQHGSPIQCIIYLDNKVFVSLVNGDLIVYKRDQEGLWDTGCPYTRTIGSASSPVTKMHAVAGKLWCGCQNQICVINPLSFHVETSFYATSDPSRAVHCLASSGQGVWVACQQSSKVLLFHAVTYEFLLEVSIAQAVSQKLQSADDIIRQHKAACLRITALMVCKDLLWIGTSAGVILTIPIPHITSTTTRGLLAIPTVTGLVYGHTGHVRFLTSVEINSSAVPKADIAHHLAGEGSTYEQAGGCLVHDIHRRSSMAAATATMASRILVISGGDGYEDFRSSTANEGAGRDDSTNHLLLWQV